MRRVPADALVLPRTRGRRAGDAGRHGATPERRPDRRERRLAARLRAGDDSALRDVYALYGAPTFGYLLRLLGDRASAEDVQQQVFTEVWRRGGEFDPRRAGLLTWIMTIARSRAIDHLRRRVPEPADPHAPEVLAAADGVRSGDADRLLDRWRMAHYLGLLPEEERALLRMRFYGDMTQSEIADATGVPLGTIKTRMVRGLERLRVLLEAEEGVPA